MPSIHIHVSGEPDEALTQHVAECAAELTATPLGKDRSLTAVVIDFIPASRWFVAGRSLAPGSARSYHGSVSITDETNTKREKAAYLGAVHAAMAGLLGEMAEHSYVHVADLRASAYGYGGVTQERRYQLAS